jgi:hypothetical protein
MSKEYSKSIKLSGTVLGTGKESVAKSGKRYTKIPFRDVKTSDIYALMFAEELLPMALALKLEQKVSLSGRKVGGKDENIVWVDFIYTDEKRTSRFKTSEESAKYQAEMREYYAKNNMVLCKTSDDGRVFKDWFHKDSCIDLGNGEWVRKIDYVMDLLGPKEVETRLRKKLSEYGGAVPKGKGHIFTRMIDDMIEEAKF